MDKLQELPMATVAIALGAVSAIGWIVFGGTAGLVISILAGSIIAIKGSLGEKTSDDT